MKKHVDLVGLLFMLWGVFGGLGVGLVFSVTAVSPPLLWVDALQSMKTARRAT